MTPVQPTSGARTRIEDDVASAREGIGAAVVKESPRRSSAIRLWAWVFAWLFLFFAFAHLSMVLYFRATDPTGTFKLYYADVNGRELDPVLMVYSGWSGTVLAGLLLVGHVTAMVVAIRGRSTTWRMATGLMALWSLVWVNGIGRVMLATREWDFYAWWIAVPALGFLSLMVLTLTRRGMPSR